MQNTYRLVVQRSAHTRARARHATSTPHCAKPSTRSFFHALCNPRPVDPAFDRSLDACITGRISMAMTGASRALRIACASGNVKGVHAALSAGADVNDDHGNAFCAACAMGHVEIARILFKLNRQICRRYMDDAFRAACRGGHLSTVKMMTASPSPRAFNIVRGFDAACYSGHVHVVQHLLALGSARCCIGGVFARVFITPYVNVAKTLLSHDATWHADINLTFWWTCVHGFVKVARFLLSLEGTPSVDVHVGDERAFRAVCKYGHTKLARLLLSQGGHRRVDVHACTEEAFREACSAGRTTTVKLLLSLEGDRRVDVHAVDDDAFWEACRHGHTDVVRLLLSLEGDRRIHVQHARVLREFRKVCCHGRLRAVKFMLTLRGAFRVSVHACAAGLDAACAWPHSRSRHRVVHWLLLQRGDRAVPSSKIMLGTPKQEMATLRWRRRRAFSIRT